MKTAWITGAHGFIGRHLARHLDMAGYRVAGIGHGAWPEADAAGWGVSVWLNGEITSSNLNLLRQASSLPEVVFHMAGGASVAAAIANPREDFARTVVSTADLLEWLRQHAPSTRLVAVSSAAVYGGGHSAPIPEAARPMPYSPYGTHKLMMEELCQSYAVNFGLAVVIPRLFSVYGPGLKKQLLWDMCVKLAGQQEIELGGTGAELRDWVHIRDAVEALHRFSALADTSAVVINHGTGHGTSVRDLADMVTAAWASASEGAQVSVAFSSRSRPGDPGYLVADISRMTRLGIIAGTSLAEGVTEYVGWYLGQRRNPA